jgi:hypothetical protein
MKKRVCEHAKGRNNDSDLSKGEEITLAKRASTLSCNLLQNLAVGLVMPLALVPAGRDMAKANIWASLSTSVMASGVT